MKKVIKSKKAPAAVGPYSQAIAVNGFVFCSGQIGIDPATNQIARGIENQTKQVMKNLEAVLKAAGLTFEHVVKTDIFLTNMADYQKVNEIYGSFFKKTPPARQTVEASALPRDALIEISCIAYEKK